jgi:hypothetical protein
MCHQKEIPRYIGLAGCTCGCCGCGCGPSFRSFFSPKEEQERLETYKDQLEKELTGVKECLNELKGK